MSLHYVFRVCLAATERAAKRACYVLIICADNVFWIQVAFCSKQGVPMFCFGDK